MTRRHFSADASSRPALPPWMMYGQRRCRECVCRSGRKRRDGERAVRRRVMMVGGDRALQEDGLYATEVEETR